MKVLMFGWEFPPHISGGLGTACHGLAHGLVAEGVSVLFVVPKLSGEDVSAAVTMINASAVPLPEEPYIPSPGPDVTVNRTTPVAIKTNRELLSTHESAVKVISPYNHPDGQNNPVKRWNYTFGQATTADEPEQTTELMESIFPSSPGTLKRYHRFSGQYGPGLMDEVKMYSRIAHVIARENDYDVIHAHDWISFRAGIEARNVSGKPLVVHVHATEFDRSGDHVDTAIFVREREGMLAADRVFAVSELTRKTIISRYGIHPEKVLVVHNGIVPKAPKTFDGLPSIGTHVVTFLGRITHQKGPRFFVEAAKLVLGKFPDAHFVVAGSGDLLPAMIDYVAHNRLSSRFHFTGFVRGNDLDKIWSMTDVYVMPSVSEPFGLTPLEAMQSGVPVIISKQSGVSEIMRNAIKIDFWDVHKLAGAICAVLKYPALSEELRKNSETEIDSFSWKQSAQKINQVYHELIKQAQL